MENVLKSELSARQDQELTSPTTTVFRSTNFVMTSILQTENVRHVLTTLSLRRAQVDASTTRSARNATENIKEMMVHAAKSTNYVQHGNKKEVNVSPVSRDTKQIWEENAARKTTISQTSNAANSMPKIARQ